MPAKELCRKHGFSEPSYYAWEAKIGGMNVSDAQRLNALEARHPHRMRRKIEIDPDHPLTVHSAGHTFDPAS